MMHVIRILLAFSTSVIIVSCAHDGPGLRVMNERSEYADDAPESTTLNLGTADAVSEIGGGKPRPEPRVAQIWVHPQRLSDREQFWGAWITLRLEGENWQAETATALEPEDVATKPKDHATRIKKQKSVK